MARCRAAFRDEFTCGYHRRRPFTAETTIDRLFEQGLPDEEQRKLAKELPLVVSIALTMCAPYEGELLVLVREEQGSGRLHCSPRP